MTFTWNSFSERLHAVKTKLQSVDLDIQMVVEIYKSLYLYFQHHAFKF
jgi:hypothetical protein